MCFSHRWNSQASTKTFKSNIFTVSPFISLRVRLSATTALPLRCRVVCILYNIIVINMEAYRYWRLCVRIHFLCVRNTAGGCSRRRRAPKATGVLYRPIWSSGIVFKTATIYTIEMRRRSRLVKRRKRTEKKNRKDLKTGMDLHTRKSCKLLAHGVRRLYCIIFCVCRPGEWSTRTKRRWWRLRVWRDVWTGEKKKLVHHL